MKEEAQRIAGLSCVGLKKRECIVINFNNSV